VSKVVRNTLIYTLGNILPQVVAFILLPIYTKHMPPSEYGIVSSMLVIQMFLAILFSFALDRSILRLYWDYKSESEKKEFLGTISISIFVISILFLILSIVFSDILQKVFPDIDFYPYYFFTIITTFSVNFSVLSKSFYRLKNNASGYFIVSLFELIISTSFILWFIVAKDEGGLGVIRGKMICFLSLSPVYFIIIIKHIKIKFKFAMLRDSLSFSLPIIPTLIAAWIIQQSDKIFIADYLSMEDVGIFSLSKRIAGLLTLVSGAFMLAYHPLYFEIANQDDKIDAKSKLYKYNNVFILSIIFMGFLLVFFCKEVIYLLLNEQYHESYKYVPWLTFGVLISSVSSTIIGASFQQSKKMKQDMYFGLIGAGISLITYYFLIKPFGLYGVVIGLFLASLIIFIMVHSYSKKHCFYIPFDWKTIIGLTILFSSIIIFFYLIIDLQIVYSIIFKSILTIVVFYVLYSRYKTYLNDLLGFKSKNIIV
jgi:O-antigen/teichoic acid export membrane protein